MASVLEKARARAPRYTNVIKLEIEPNALPATQHDPAELKPNATSAANAPFKRRF
jgi:hypothetical protein